MEIRNKAKHDITSEELDFLIELQKELNTQDTVCQADPRFWVVATDNYKELGTEDCFDEFYVYSHDGSEIICDGDIESMIEYAKENYPEKMESISFIDRGPFYRVVFGEEYDETFVYDSDDLLEFFKKQGIFDDDYEFAYYRKVHHIYPDTMFLTNRSCKEHIQLNHYHYADDAHSYAMTAWRSSEVEKLWDILQKVDWKSLKEKI